MLLTALTFNDAFYHFIESSNQIAQRSRCLNYRRPIIIWTAHINTCTHTHKIPFCRLQWVFISLLCPCWETIHANNELKMKLLCACRFSYSNNLKFSSFFSFSAHICSGHFNETIQLTIEKVENKLLFLKWKQEAYWIIWCRHFLLHFILKAIFFYLRHKNSRFCHVSLQTISYTVTEWVSLYFISGCFVSNFFYHIRFSYVTVVEMDFCVCRHLHSRLLVTCPNYFTFCSCSTHLPYYKNIFGFHLSVCFTHYNNHCLQTRTRMKTSKLFKNQKNVFVRLKFLYFIKCIQIHVWYCRWCCWSSFRFQSVIFILFFFFFIFSFSS